ncbi:putative integral membrane protein [Phaeoacremonium minimum UCRPA7]|uniref:Putative integral membrane protein n=1 Tax=Phaeoacremonium minimum (strain UCR-PA7) TaxID=1286976 RepID=R8BSA0_PHAM7|nr:putative integral membrane protein [Phaeoacremonium minimum UCRPA7]EOO02170.1 putative integral membrane protein [Phaeoacremonium minimum UCRPA7]
MGVVSGCVGIVKATGVPTLGSQDVSFDLCDPLYWTSIEGNLIIIAACIPLLQPVVEKIKGRSIWRSSKTGSSNRQYANFSKQSARQADPIELHSKPKKKVDVYGFTIHAKEDSEENIVNPDKQSTTTSSGRHSGTYQPNDRIMKTDVVTVTYDQGPQAIFNVAAQPAHKIKDMCVV